MFMKGACKTTQQLKLITRILIGSNQAGIG